ncbi:MAG: hypothetical protein KGD73_08135 [Candidatus Lokiarchaeota archaeon]|nr:hypothetical protein [Candidatus Lokiarchaeota archaeon]
MGFGKSFGFSLLTYIGLNFLFLIIAETISGDLNNIFTVISADPFIIILILFGPITNTPGIVFNGIIIEVMGPLRPDVLIEFVGYIVSPFIAAIVAGRVGEKKGASFGGFLLTTVLSALAVSALVFLSPSSLMAYTLPTNMTTIVFASIGGITNGVFYGAFALLFTKTEMY